MVVPCPTQMEDQGSAWELLRLALRIGHVRAHSHTAPLLKLTIADTAQQPATVSQPGPSRNANNFWANDGQVWTDPEATKSYNGTYPSSDQFGALGDLDTLVTRQYRPQSSDPSRDATQPSSGSRRRQ